jgi:predicted glycosyltransferase
MKTILFAVTHLLGTGHLSRVSTLGQAYMARGWRVVIVSGGRPAPHLLRPGMELIQLPPVSVEGADYKRLLDPDGVVIDTAYREARRDRILDALHATAPDVVVTELYPFGRQLLRLEFDALLDAAHAMRPKPLILASSRDILEPPRKLEKAQKTEERLANRYDGVLVHADPVLIRLEATWPDITPFADKLHYTGYVAAQDGAAAAPDDQRTGDILVTAGGGNLGARLRLFEQATDAAVSDPQGRRWRILVGGGGADERVNALMARPGAGERFIAEKVHAGFRDLLAQAPALVGQSGYNTAMDLLVARCPAVFCPFEDGGETEQLARARLWANHGPFEVTRSENLTADDLLGALDRVTGPDRAAFGPIDINGAMQSVDITETLLLRLKDAR